MFIVKDIIKPISKQHWKNANILMLKQSEETENRSITVECVSQTINPITTKKTEIFPHSDLMVCVCK